MLENPTYKNPSNSYHTGCDVGRDTNFCLLNIESLFVLIIVVNGCDMKAWLSMTNYVHSTERVAVWTTCQGCSKRDSISARWPQTPDNKYKNGQNRQASVRVCLSVELLFIWNKYKQKNKCQIKTATCGMPCTANMTVVSDPGEKATLHVIASFSVSCVPSRTSCFFITDSTAGTIGSGMGPVTPDVRACNDILSWATHNESL